VLKCIIHTVMNNIMYVYKLLHISKSVCTIRLRTCSEYHKITAVKLSTTRFIILMALDSSMKTDVCTAHVSKK
jgi:hypothetical protein